MTEANYWRQRYEMLMATFSDALKAAANTKPPIILADGESYEAGRIAGIESSKRQWIDLTDEDKKQIAKEANYNWEMTIGEYAERIGRLTEAKLKEKNT